jgi:hypothetical protein
VNEPKDYSKLPMEGFFQYDPNADEDDEAIQLWELVYALQGAANTLNSDGVQERDQEGMRIAVRVLATLLCKRYTSEEVIRKPKRPPPDGRPRKRRSRAASVLSLVKDGSKVDQAA